MFIAVSNAHGWGKAKTERGALNLALKNSFDQENEALRVRVWDCTSEAYVDGHGVPWGILSDPKGREFKRVRKHWENV